MTITKKNINKKYSYSKKKGKQIKRRNRKSVKRSNRKSRRNKHKFTMRGGSEINPKINDEIDRIKQELQNRSQDIIVDKQKKFMIYAKVFLDIVFGAENYTKPSGIYATPGFILFIIDDFFFDTIEKKLFFTIKRKGHGGGTEGFLELPCYITFDESHKPKEIVECNNRRKSLSELANIENVVPDNTSQYTTGVPDNISVCIRDPPDSTAISQCLAENCISRTPIAEKLQKDKGDSLLEGANSISSESANPATYGREGGGKKKRTRRQ